MISANPGTDRPQSSSADPDGLFPPRSSGHCVVLFDAREDFVRPFQDRLAVRFPAYDPESTQWTMTAEIPPCIHGTLDAGEWKFHWMYQAMGRHPRLEAALDGCRFSPAARNATVDQGAAMLSLLQAPAGTHPWARMCQLAGVAHDLLDLGAGVIAWPLGKKAWYRDELQRVNLSALEPAHFEWFVDWRLAGEPANGVEWIRTHGLEQFDLPEMAWTVPAGSDPDDADGVKASQFFECVPPYVIERNEPLPAGDWITVHDTVWDVAGWADELSQPALASGHGTQIFVRRDA